MKPWKLLFIMAVAAAALFTGCTINQRNEVNLPNGKEKAEENIEENVTPVKGGILNLSMMEAKNLNPLLNADASVNQVLYLIYDSLVEYDEHYNVIPNLAESWSFSPDGTVLTMKLRRGVHWHDGEPFTAQDVLYSLDTIKDPKNNSPYQKLVENIISYSAEDPSTIRILLGQPYLGALESMDFPIIASHYYGADLGNSPNNMKPMGTGAYRFKEYQSLKYMTLQANENYFDGSPYIPLVQVKILPDENTALSAFDQKQIDVIGTEVVDWEKYTEMNQTRIHEYVSRNYDFIGFNFSHPILSNVNVRKGIAYGVDREQIIKKAYLGHGKVVDVPMNPESYLYNAEVSQYQYDMDKAKQALIDPNTHEPIQVAFSLLVNGESKEKSLVADRIQKDLSKIGIDVTIQQVSWEEYQRRLESKSFDAVLGSFRLSSIPDLGFAFHSQGSRNFINYSNPSMDMDLKDAFQSIDPATRKKIFFKLQKQISADLPYLSLNFRTSAFITNARIKGIKPPVVNRLYRQVNTWFDSTANEIEDSRKKN